MLLTPDMCPHVRTHVLPVHLRAPKEVGHSPQGIMHTAHTDHSRIANMLNRECATHFAAAAYAWGFHPTL